MVLQPVAAQPIVSEIVAWGTKHRVDVVWIVRQMSVWRDHIVVLDQQRGPVDAIVDALARLRRPHPGEMDVLKSGSLDGSAIVARYVRPEVREILIDKSLEYIAPPVSAARGRGPAV